MPHNCGFCDKPFGSSGGVKKHIATHPECRRKWESTVIDTDDEDGAPVDFTYNETFSPLRRSRSESFDFEEDNPIASKSRRVTVEDVTDEEDGRRYFEPYPEAGWTLREGQTEFERYQQYKEGEGEDKWAPFGNEYESRFLYLQRKLTLVLAGKNGDLLNGLSKALGRLKRMNF